MKILQVVHSFIPYTMAGTEVYSYRLSKELSKQHQVFVFFRVNLAKEKEYALIYNKLDELETYAINHTFRFCNSFKATYSDEAINKKFGELLDKIKPDIVHIHHLLFLSHGIVREIKKRNIPIVYTLHDYWLICYRGQLVKDDLTVCTVNSISQCRECLKYLLVIKNYAMFLYRLLRRNAPPFLLGLLKKFYLGISTAQSLKEIEKLKNSREELFSKIDLFIAPSNFIKNEFIKHGLVGDKIIYSAYGFDSNGLFSLGKSESSILRFGYLGTLLPMKGVDILISAFKGIDNKNTKLLIYGKLFCYSNFEYYPGFLKKSIGNDSRIELKGGYDNKDVGKILSNIDVLIVPSIWLENSPLVIQESFLAKTPVIASRIGGIPELVSDGINGLLFNPGDSGDLKEKMQYIIDSPGVLKKFRENMPKVKAIADNAKETQETYSKLIARNKGR